MIFIKSGLMFKSLKVASLCTEMNCEVGAVRLSFQNQNVCVLSVYRSPLGNLETFITQLSSILIRALTAAECVFVCGDFNVDYLGPNCSVKDL